MKQDYERFFDHKQLTAYSNLNPHTLNCFVWITLFFFLICFENVSHGFSDQQVNIYAWTGEIPDLIVRQFTQETGISVNISTYENNEIMYTKLRMLPTPSYDIVMPSSYFVDRMQKQDMLTPLDKTRLTNWRHLDPNLLHRPYDPKSQYSVPYLWGATGIFVNTRFFSPRKITHWADLWDPQYQNQLMLLDDMREVFGMGLLSLGLSVNENRPYSLKQTFLRLKQLMQNTKVFSTDMVISLMIDEDATIGMAWNGDAFKASQSNKHIHFVFPKEGFIVWIDHFAIPKNAPHLQAAYAFIDFMLRPDIAQKVALYTHYPIANLTGRKRLPAAIRNNPILYPPQQLLKHAHFQQDLDDATLSLCEQYWEILKISDE